MKRRHNVKHDLYGWVASPDGTPASVRVKRYDYERDEFWGVRVKDIPRNGPGGVSLDWRDGRLIASHPHGVEAVIPT